MKRRRSDLRDLCAHTHEDDGLDPRYTRKETTRSSNRKDQQLCKQVQRCLASSLELECRDSVLSQLEVVEVVPDPNIGRLRVTIAPRASGVPATAIFERLQAAKGFLRSQVAAAISRKRVPELVFRIGPREVRHD